ncbi:MAG: hypothetical protein QXI16_00145 [Sulfolobaceae archaeon]
MMCESLNECIANADSDYIYFVYYDNNFYSIEIYCKRFNPMTHLKKSMQLWNDLLNSNAIGIIADKKFTDIQEMVNAKAKYEADSRIRDFIYRRIHKRNKEGDD